MTGIWSLFAGPLLEETTLGLNGENGWKPDLVCLASKRLV